MAACRSCNADIEWAEWVSSRKPIPLDAKPSPKGNLAVVAGKVHYYGAEDARLGRERRTSHFANCPDAQKWRR